MNYHDFQFGLPNVVERQDYTLFVDAYTGERRSWKQFEKRVGDAATALASLLGLDAEKGHIVGILSENSMVRFVSIQLSLSIIQVVVTEVSALELCRFCASRCLRVLLLMPFEPYVCRSIPHSSTPRSKSPSR